MPRHAAALALLALTAAAAGAQSRAPLTVGVGGGPSVAGGALGDQTGTGWQLTARAGVPLRPAKLGVRADLAYHHLPGDAGEIERLAQDAEGQIDDISATGKTTVISGAVDLVYTPGGVRSATPYFFGGAGVYRLASTFSVCGVVREVDDRTCFSERDFGSRSATRLGLGVGAGMRFAVGGAQAFIEAQLHNIFTTAELTRLIPVSVGIEFGRK